MKVWTVICVLKTPSGMMTIPMKHYDNEDAANRSRDECNGGMAGLLQDAKVVVPTDTVPKVLMPLAQFIGQMCITSIGYLVAPAEVHGAVVLEARSQIIMPGRN